MPFKYKRQSSQVFVEYRDQVTETKPLKNRTYTMTHSDTTGDLFVTIGLSYAEDKTNELQDQVYLSWTPIQDKFFLYGEVLVDGPSIKGESSTRDAIFKREMPLALHAIYTADLPLFNAYKELEDTPILINFKSNVPKYNKLYSYGTIGSYTHLP